MTEYWLCAAGDTLRRQISNHYPHKDTASEGWIGDSSHAATVSDHNPCWTCTGTRYGVVRAIDIDSDLEVPPNPRTAQTLADQLIQLARERSDGGRLKYVIFDHRIASGTAGYPFWRWRPYSGSDPHTSHIHVSFNDVGDFHGQRFSIDLFGKEDDVVTKQEMQELVTMFLSTPLFEGDKATRADKEITVKDALRKAARLL